MGRYFSMCLLTLAGAVFGAAAVTSFNAQGKAPAAYVIVDITSINNPDAFKAIMPKIGPANAAVGAKPIVTTENIIGLDGTPPKRFAIVSFDTMEKAKAWNDSPGVKEVNDIRKNTTTSRSFIVEALPN